MIEAKDKEILKLENELPILQDILNRTWSKSEELSSLKVQCETIQKKIDEELRRAEQPHSVTEITDNAA